MARGQLPWSPDIEVESTVEGERIERTDCLCPPLAGHLEREDVWTQRDKNIDGA